MALLDSVMFTHQPTWDDCQQLLRILFTTEERERIQVEARKLVPGDDGQPTANPDLINATFPLTRPAWDYNMAEGRGRLHLYRQTLIAGLRAAARKPTNLAKVYSVLQGKTESPATYLERLMEAFRQYTPIDPEAPGSQAAVVMSFVNQDTVLNLKDAFFSLPLAPQSQKLFAFEWNDPGRGISGQLTWTRLLQGFKNSPTLFDEALHEDLGEY